MTVHEISEGNRTPKRNEKWRDDWHRSFFRPRFEQYADNVWFISPHCKAARHRPTNAVFELKYGTDSLLHSVRFLPKNSDAPATDWDLNGPEMRELVTQVSELYLHWRE